MIAVIGLGRAKDGSLLSSEDLEILQMVSGYVAVAIENSLLYEEQEKRAEELRCLRNLTNRLSNRLMSDCSPSTKTEKSRAAIRRLKKCSA
jgi:GAF domain-containing protein